MSTAPDHVSDRVLVTGAQGWLGSRLVAALACGLPDVPDLVVPVPRTEIRCLVRPGHPLERHGSALVTSTTGDVTDLTSLTDFFRHAEGATLYHCAGVIHPRRASAFDAINAAGTRHVLAAAARAGVRRVIHVSSNSPFGANPTPHDVFDEAAPYAPYMGYGRSKRAAEEAVLRIRDAGLLETVIVRAPWFYGPGQPPRQTQFFTMVKQGRFPVLGDGSQARSMAYVDNLCHGLLRCERRPEAAGETFWIADQRPYPMHEIVDTVARVLREFHLDVSQRRLRLPSWTADAARIADRLVQGIGLYEQRVHVLSEMNLTIACSIRKAMERLGYRPAIALEEGMRRSIAWVLAQGATV